jgi:osmotically-inducible protein OsmY
LAGVQGVTNLIAVKPSTFPSELKKKIEDALIRNAQLDAKNISVEVQGGKAILRGTVRAWIDKEEAERVAWSAPGITEVDNRITLEV